MSFFSASVPRCAVRVCLGVMAATFAVTIAGCESNPLSGAKLYPVKGRVLLPDGKPLSSGHVVFISNKTTVTSTANIESDGSYTFKGTSGDGLPEGDYKIRIEPGSSTDVKPGSPKSVKGSLPFDDQFLDEDTSGLTATVTTDEAKNSFELSLKPTKSATGAGGRKNR